MDVNTPNAPPTQYTSSEHWSIPATHPQAVYAFAELQVLTEHLVRVERVIREIHDLDRRNETIRDVANAAARRATEVTGKIRKSATTKILPLFEDLDVARSMPDQITFLPRVVWLLGALAALATVRSAAVDAEIRTQFGGSDRAEAFAVALRHAVAEARARWDFQAEELLRRHPWVRGQHVHFELVDLETPRPRFRIPIID